MTTNRTNDGALRRNPAMTAVIAGAVMFIATAATAGECPADKIVASGQGQKAGATMPKDVMDMVLGSIALADEPVAIEGRQLRMRRLEIQPGGVVPWHSHEDRPAIIYVVQGEVTEYSSECAAPIVHMTGEVSVETHGVAHWWKNTGADTVVLISADLLRAEDDASTM
ncbi:MAG: cupin domain-containing protein [Dongiaceae bacterium]